MNKDLTTGQPERVLRQFCLPLFASVIFQQLYNIADSFVAGKFIGNSAIAAVGNSYEITLIFIAFSFGCNIGCSVIAARYFGAKEYGKLKTAVYTTFISAAVLCAVLMLLGFAFSDALLVKIDTPEEIFADSKLYLDIYMLGLPFVIFYNISTGIFSALGDSRTPFIFLACSSTGNIFMDILFVKAFGMGVAGVAWATFICQGISCILAVFFVLKRFKAIPCSEKPPVFSGKILLQIAQIAVPSILQQSFISVGNIIIQGQINSFGTDAIAGYAAAIKLNNLVITSLTTLGNGVSSYTAQNLGAGKTARIVQGFKAGVKLVWIICVPFALLYCIAGKYILLIFLENSTGAAAQTGAQLLRIVAPFYLIVSLKLVSDGILRGSGMMKEFMAGTLTDLALRVILAVILAKTALGCTGIWLSWPVGWIVATVISLYCYRKGYAKKQ